MKKSVVLVVGESAAGIVAGVSARQCHKNARITLVRKEKQACFLSAIPYIFGTLGSTDKDVTPDAILSKMAWTSRARNEEVIKKNRNTP